ncbi:hypothetical protein [Altererythrobacter sp. MF3-039]|uniref:hypothetical protein n=1 Tax=Altererythrobacter sp. MF3-039 TaxID=3252901 RepID=UPI00390C5ACC
MTNKMKSFAKGGIATSAVGAMALATAAPAYADHRDRDKIGAGEIIAGAVILGGIAAIANSSKRDRYDYRDDRRYRSDYRRGGNPRRAVEKCVRAVERDARRSGYRYADVTQIRDVDDTRYGWRVKGRLEVANRGYDRYRDYRRDRYDRYDRHDRRGYHRSDDGKFTCFVERGRVADIRYKGLRRL